MTKSKPNQIYQKANRHGWKRNAVPFASAILLAGCSSGTNPPATPLPAPPAPSNATAYVGTQSPGFWTMSVDTTQNVFSYQSALASTATVSGGLTTRNFVLDFGNASGIALGRAVAVPAGGALLRPGSEATLPVAMVQQSDCFAIVGRQRYIYAGLLNAAQRGQSVSDTGYGTFAVSTSSDGKTWNIGGLHNFVLTTLNGGAYSVGTENGSDPASFSATCDGADKQGKVTANANPAFPADSSNAPSLPAFHFNPGGAFIEERSSGTNWVGFAMPQAAIKPADVSAGIYRGFVFEGTTSTPVDTRTVAFATPTSSGPTLVGGVFPNEDLGAISLNEYSLTLGTQDSVLNGVFPNARLNVFDANGYCATVARADSSVTVGFDVGGSEICTAAGVAVVSQVGGKYILYFTSRDGTKEPNTNSSFVIQFYLYQQ